MHHREWFCRVSRSLPKDAWRLKSYRSFEEGSPSVRIYIGARNDDSKPYILPKHVLCESSRYFKKALSKKFIEGQTGVLHFPEDDEAAWQILLYFILRNKVVEFGEAEDDFSRWESPSDLAHTYTLAEKYELPACQNAIVRAFSKLVGDNCLRSKDYNELLAFLPAGSALQRIVLEDMVLAELRSRHEWEDCESLARFPGVMPALIRAVERRLHDPENFSPHNYGAILDDYLVYEQMCED